MNNEHIKNNIREVMKNNQLTVIATIDEETKWPEAAVIGFAENEDLCLVFGTSNRSRKYKNIQKNPRVSFVIGWDHMGTVQYEGEARELSGEEVEKHAQIMVLKNKQTDKFRSMPDQRYFFVKPTWIRLVDHRSETGGVYEITL